MTRAFESSDGLFQSRVEISVQLVVPVSQLVMLLAVWRYFLGLLGEALFCGYCLCCSVGLGHVTAAP